MKTSNKFGIAAIVFGLSFTTLQSVAQQLTVAPAHLVCDYQVPDKLDTQVKSVDNAIQRIRKKAMKCLTEGE